MTDNDILKALELSPKCNPVEGRCSICPYLLIDDCFGKFPKDALDLINRQKAEIERLQKANERFEKEFDSYYARVKFQAYDEFAERLKAIAFLPLGTWCTKRVITENDIDQIAKEMKEGVNNA